MEYVWNMYGICMEYVPNMCGTCMEYVGAHVWNMYGICPENVTDCLCNMYGTSKELLRNMYRIHTHWRDMWLIQ